MRIMLLLLPVLATGCARFKDGQGASVVLFGTDLNMVTTSTTNRSGGGPSTLFTGASRGERTTTRTEAQSRGLIQVGGIRIEGGTLDQSTGIGEVGFIAASIGRIIGMTKSVSAMFDWARNRDNVGGATDQLESTNAARTDQARIAGEVKRSQIR